MGLLLISMWLLSGCVVTPIEAQDGSTPDGAAATIAIAPISGAPGDTVFVSGAGWASNESVYVNLEHTPDQEPVQTTVSIATTDGDGRFNVTFTYPVDPVWREPGMVDVVAYSLDGSARAVAAFEVLESAPPSETATPVATATPTSTPTAAAGQPTATRAPAATPTPTRATGNVGTVVSSALNVRSGPSTAFPIERSIARGTQFTVLGQNHSGAWLFVRLNDGLEGWLARAYTNYAGLAPTVPSPKPPAPTPKPTATRPPQGSGWRGEYFNNSHLSGDPALVRDDAKIDFDWGYGSPAYGINDDFFSVRWVRSFYLSAGTYRFYAAADDGVRVWVNGEQIIDEWHLASGQTYSAVKRVDSGSALVRVEFYEATQIAKIRFWWEPVQQQNYPDWRGEYYSNRDLSGSPAFVRNDYAVDFDWGTGSPANNFPSDNFSVRWTREAHFDAGTYRFHALMDDGMRVYLDDGLIIDEWRSGSVREITRDIYVGQGTHRLRVEYFEDGNRAVAKLWWERRDDQPENFPDWKGEYWDNRHLDGSPRLTRNDRAIDFNWGSGSPDSRIPNDHFSARWTRWVDFDDARYRFYARADDGVRVWVGDDRVINEWHDNSADVTYTGEIDLDGDERVKVEYYERTGGARVEVWWQKIDDSPDPDDDDRDEPYLEVLPAQGPTGTRVEVRGGGFPDGRTVNLFLGGVVQASAADAANAEVRASTRTNGDGEFSMSFNIPNTWPDGSRVEPGRLVLLVATNDFNHEATGFFEVTSPPVSGGNPTAQVSPNSGGAGTDVTVRGGGFPANTRVRAYLAGLVGIASANADNMRDYASTTTDGQGNYEMRFEMPDEWPDDDDIETGKLLILVATDDFSVEASAEFSFFKEGEEVEAAIEISPGSGGAGTSVRVRGEGFPDEVTVNIYLGALDSQEGGDAGDRVYATTNTDDDGEFDTAFTMPREWPDGSSVDSGRIVIIAANRDRSVVAGASFEYSASGTPNDTPTPTATVANPTPTRAPSINVNPNSGGEGTRVTVNGEGFPPSTTVNAHLAKFGGNGVPVDDARIYASTVTDGNGNYSLSFRMPEEWPDGDDIDDGRILVVIATNDFSRQASATFNYNAASTAGELATVVPTSTVASTVTPVPTATLEGLATAVPTDAPTQAPTATAVPTEAPTEVPPTATAVPTDAPTEAPTDVPTEAPTNTPEPTAVPTEVATEVPTKAATEVPTNTPEPTATAVPTEAPTNTPEPTAVPTEAPTEAPTEVSTNTPEPAPTEAPTALPTAAPTEAATEVPTNTPEPAPTEAPTAAATEAPTDVPPTTAPPEAPPEAPPTNTLEPTPTFTATPVQEAPAQQQVEEPPVDVEPTDGPSEEPQG